MIHLVTGIWLFCWLISVGIFLLEYADTEHPKGIKETLTVILYCVVLILTFPLKLISIGKQILKGM